MLYFYNMCIACSGGVPVCAVSGACSVGLQHALAAGAIVGTGFFAIARTWASMQARTFMNYLKRNQKNNWE